ncbi:MAG TPA: arylsulfatase [Chthoniobacteraceae bacterium]|nr:arylsulfatase [Chthoniobacteraceae bacterium]
MAILCEGLAGIAFQGESKISRVKGKELNVHRAVFERKSLFMEASRAATPDEEPPNILFIMTDQQRGDCLGAEGAEFLLTPNLDELAGDGMRFRCAYSTSPVCIPARRSLMSGMHPATHGMVGYCDHQEWNPPATLPQLLRDAGYHTGLVGRTMHLHPKRKRYGFEEMVIQSGQEPLTDYEAFLQQQAPSLGGRYATGVMHNDWTARSWPVGDDLHPTHWTLNEAKRFLDRRDPSRPWFLTVSFLAPHPPLIPPDFYFQRYLRTPLPEPVIGDWAEEPDFRGNAPRVDSPRVNLRGEALLSCRAAYYALINHIDDQIHRLLTRVSAAGGVDHRKTLVVFTSDHGEMLGDHHLFRKSLPYEAAARIPFLIRLPMQEKEVPRGEVCDLPVCLEDLMPTLLDAAGVPIPEWVDGRSLLSVLRGEKVGEWREDLLIEIGGGKQAFHALTDGREKFIRFSGDGREQFFDLANDPGEERDLIHCPQEQGRIALWRERMIARLADRPEGFVQNGKLVAGRPHRVLVPSEPIS